MTPLPTNMTKEEILKIISQQNILKESGGLITASSEDKPVLSGIAELLADIYQKLEAVGKADEPHKGEETITIPANSLVLGEKFTVTVGNKVFSSKCGTTEQEEELIEKYASEINSTDIYKDQESLLRIFLEEYKNLNHE